jgi:DNA processing protein
MINEKLAVWALSGIDGIGPAIFMRLVTSFGTAAAVFERSCDELVASEMVNRSLATKILAHLDWEKVQSQFANACTDGAEFVAFTDDRYPSRLKNIPDPPPFLYCRGDLSIFERPMLAIVGSRRPTDYGIRMTSKLAGELGAAGVVIVSGLAYGIDGAAHQAALEAGGCTIAVFGCGLDIIYPPGHKSLAERIAKSGCLISEFPKGTRPERFNFPIRNRIVAGLSNGVLVVEAGARSGALVTAAIGLEQDRDVMAVPGRIDSELSAGPNGLIKQGAIAVTAADDIFSNFGWHRSTIAAEPKHDLSKLSREERTVYESLSVQPLHIDELARKAAFGPGKIAEALLNLELKGLIMRKPGNYVVKA